MKTVENLRVLIFLSLVATVYILAAASIIRWGLHRFHLVALSPKPAQVWLRRVALSLAFIGIVPKS